MARSRTSGVRGSVAPILERLGIALLRSNLILVPPIAVRDVPLRGCAGSAPEGVPHTSSAHGVIEAYNPSGAPLQGLAAAGYVGGDAENAITVAVWVSYAVPAWSGAAESLTTGRRVDAVTMAPEGTARSPAAKDRNAALDGCLSGR